VLIAARALRIGSPQGKNKEDFAFFPEIRAITSIQKAPHFG
jgi:hypothetical protein